MKAAILKGIDQMVVKEVPDPEIGDGEMLIRVRACAVCGSDIRIYHHGHPRVTPPAIIGHEVAGDVVQVGKDVQGFQAGDRVAIGADVPCGACYFCRNGLGNNCAINYAIGHQFPGGFAEYMPLNEMTIRYGPVHKMPDHLSYEEATIAEPLACALNGLELAMLKPGDTVVIIGAGPAGCLLAELSKVLGATKVILAQRSRHRLELAKQFRADVLVCTQDEDLVERVKEETEGEGADVIVTACASAEAQEQALLMAAHRARINFFGGLPRGSRKISVDSNLIHYRECYVLGSHGSVPRQHRIALEMIANGMIPAGKLITHRFPLAEIMEAFRVMESREAMKAVINP